MGNSKYGNGMYQTNLESLGNDNYNKNKGFSSDMYVKVSVNGKPVLDEISLKKDTTSRKYLQWSCN